MACFSHLEFWNAFNEIFPIFICCRSYSRFSHHPLCSLQWWFFSETYSTVINIQLLSCQKKKYNFSLFGFFVFLFRVSIIFVRKSAEHKIKDEHFPRTQYSCRVWTLIYIYILPRKPRTQTYKKLVGVLT